MCFKNQILAATNTPDGPNLNKPKTDLYLSGRLSYVTTTRHNDACPLDRGRVSTQVTLMMSGYMHPYITRLQIISSLC